MGKYTLTSVLTLFAITISFSNAFGAGGVWQRKMNRCAEAESKLLCVGTVLVDLVLDAKEEILECIEEATKEGGEGGNTPPPPVNPVKEVPDCIAKNEKFQGLLIKVDRGITERQACFGFARNFAEVLDSSPTITKLLKKQPFQIEVRVVKEQNLSYSSEEGILFVPFSIKSINPTAILGKVYHVDLTAASGEYQSPHPYNNNFEDKKEIVTQGDGDFNLLIRDFPNVKLQIKAVRFETEATHDTLKVLANGATLLSLSGNQTGKVQELAPSAKYNLIFKSDSSSTGWGAHVKWQYILKEKEGDRE